jgi:hypothetical protein
MDHLEGRGDYFGVHAHSIRLCAQRRVWVHDFDDAQQIASSTRFSLDAYAQWAGARPCDASGRELVSSRTSW